MKFWKFWDFWKNLKFWIFLLHGFHGNFLLHGFHGIFVLHGCLFFGMVYIKFHTKSWICSSKNGWVIANSMVHGIFLAWISMQIFLCIDAHFFGWSIQTSMRNPESVAQKMSELYLIPWSMEFFLHGFHANISLHGCPFCRESPYEL